MFAMQHVVFGRVEAGMETLRQMEALGSAAGKTNAHITISDCGQVSMQGCVHVVAMFLCKDVSIITYTLCKWCGHMHLKNIGTLACK